MISPALSVTLNASMTIRIISRYFTVPMKRHVALARECAFACASIVAI